MYFPVSEFLPDLPDFNNPGATTVQNVLPFDIASYGPMPGLTKILGALGTRCQGAFGMRDMTETPYQWAGDSTKLYQSTAGSSGWMDVSKSGGYSIASDEHWEFEQFGNRVIATDYADNIQSFVAGSSSAFADLAAAAPKAKHLAVVRDFLVVGNTNDPTNGQQTQRLWWSAINNPGNWPTPGTSSAAAVQSDYQDIVGSHGELQRIITNVGPIDAAIFMEKAVFAMMYVGAPDIFSILPVRGVKGLWAPQSAVLTEDGVFYLAPDGFYMFNGAYPVPLGHQKVDKWFLKNLNTANVWSVLSAVDPANKLIFVAWPSTNSQTAGILDSMLVCNYRLESALGSLGRWTYITGLDVEYIFKAVSFGYTLDQLYTVLGYTIDNLPFPLDSPVWSGGGNENLAAFDSTHTQAFFTGSNLAPTVDTGEKQLLKGRMARVAGALPLVDGGAPSIAVGTRDRTIDSASYGTAAAVNSQGYCPVDAASRYQRFRITLPSGSTFSHIQGVEVPDDLVEDWGLQ